MGWTDFKYLLKKKAAAINKDQMATGGGPSNTVPLNDLELRIISLLGPSFYKGVGSEEIATPNTKINLQPAQSILFRKEVNYLSPSIIANTSASCSKKDTFVSNEHDYGIPTPKKKRKLSNEQKEMEIFEEILIFLKNIKVTMQEGLSCISNELERIATAMEQNTNKII
ncbi:unnamed protein product [Psylliodes chrysocephalus]|uniref:Uncharacterized protein n=1 Tax=Psylliodes chrysocephalus TaxID=3402493 RepID=A0A9P0CYT4_9CUCU|nr:unnamed protein product [Psylliodes chrysocephala]